MNLKYVHIFFITLSVCLCLGIGWMQFSAWRQSGNTFDIAAALACAIAGLALATYGVFFIRKARKIIL